MTRWLVTLTGAEADLERIVERSDEEDWQIIRHEKRGVVLCSLRFEAADDYEIVGRMAEELISHINRSARYQASDFQGVSRGKIVEQPQDRDHVIALVGLAVETNAVASIGWKKLTPNGTIIETSEDRARKESASSFRRLVMLQEAHPDLADALRYLEEEPNMYGSYKAREAILCAIGKLKKPKKCNALVKLGLASEDELKRFAYSTQMKRHHRSAEPQRPMTVREANAYARELLDKLIAHLNSTSS